MDHTNGTSFAYHEREAEIERSEERLGLRPRPHIRMPAAIANDGFHPMPMPELTPEQAREVSWKLYGALVDMHNVVAERGQITDLIISHVWCKVRTIVREASKLVPNDQKGGR